MQAVRRNMQYASAGVQKNDFNRLRVQSHVYLPDATAGMEQDPQDRKAFVHDGPVPSSRRRFTVSRNAALIFLCVLFVVFGYQVLVRAVAKSQESKNISLMEQSIYNTILENQGYAVEVAQARDSSRICYRAVQELGMVSSAAVEAVPVVAPDTRPHDAYRYNTAAAASPSAAGQISGSR